jgi:Uma2 family endonuclease
MGSDKAKEHFPDRVRETGWTYEEYAKLPDNGSHYEIADGVLELLAPGPTPQHQSVSGQIQFILNQSCRNNYIILQAPLDVVLAEKEVRQPDIIMIDRSRRNIIQPHAVVGPPDLVIEILSPSTARRDKLAKKKAYAKYGVPEYWIVDPVHLWLEQYLPQEGNCSVYDLAQLYTENDPVESPNIHCITLRMSDLQCLF